MILVAGCGGEISSHSRSDALGTGGSPESAVDTSTGGISSATGGKGGNGGTGGLAGAGGTGDAAIDDSPPSCRGLPSSCGPSSSESCCTSEPVPGGTFYRSYDNVNAGYTSKAYPATLSAFRLDRYEITVGRFRKFLSEYSPDMIPAGAGKNPNDESDPGWDTTWNTALATDAATLATALQCGEPYQTWTDDPGANEDKPITCLSWFEAFAFCIWDGGRLPTEAEWNYTAAGGSEQRVYPWGGTAPTDELAVFCGASCTMAQNVGAKSPGGDGKWGHADLAGNAYEWVLDYFERPYPQASCHDCANTLVSDGRAFRGGAFSSDAAGLLASARSGGGQGDHSGGLGSRCARAAK